LVRHVVGVVAAAEVVPDVAALVLHQNTLTRHAVALEAVLDPDAIVRAVTLLRARLQGRGV
jgi:hypothetical protein